MRNSRRAILGAVPLFVLSFSLLLPPAGAAQRPEPPVPDTTPAPPASYTAGAPAVPPTIPNVAAVFQALEKARFNAMVKGDRALLGPMLSDDLTYTHSTGEVDTKASLLASLASGKLHYVAITPSEVRVKVFGETTAILTGKVDFKVVSDGKELSFPARFTSVYTRRNGNWQLAAWQSTRLSQ